MSEQSFFFGNKMPGRSCPVRFSYSLLWSTTFIWLNGYWCCFYTISMCQCALYGRWVCFYRKLYPWDGVWKCELCQNGFFTYCILHLNRGHTNEIKKRQSVCVCMVHLMVFSIFIHSFRLFFFFFFVLCRFFSIPKNIMLVSTKLKRWITLTVLYIWHKRRTLRSEHVRQQKRIILIHEPNTF